LPLTNTLFIYFTGWSEWIVRKFPDPASFKFKWSDNMQDDNDPLDWYVYGDVAPGGRFNYMYSLKGI